MPSFSNETLLKKTLVPGSQKVVDIPGQGRIFRWPTLLVQVLETDEHVVPLTQFALRPANARDQPRREAPSAASCC
jgi:hypothetical protein